jgi:hypothetical protein
MRLSGLNGVAALRVSSERLAEAFELRDLALRVVAAHGMDQIVTASGGDRRQHVQSAEVGGLSILFGNPDGQQRLDIWHGRKVLSLAWDRTGLAEVIAFKPGAWRDILRA